VNEEVTHSRHTHTEREPFMSCAQKKGLYTDCHTDTRTDETSIVNYALKHTSSPLASLPLPRESLHGMCQSKCTLSPT